MSNSEDVKALFRRFGGNASSYQEIVSHGQVGQAEGEGERRGQVWHALVEGRDRLGVGQ